MNTRLLRRVQKHILAEPKSFDMFDWQNKTSCGTERCIAGWTVVLGGKVKPNATSEQLMREIRKDSAEKLLGIDAGEGEFLFHSMMWPSKFRTPYFKAAAAHSRRRMALWASKMIDWFIEYKRLSTESED
jgi:hypothetical protein